MREKVTQVASLPYKSAYIQRWISGFYGYPSVPNGAGV